MYHFDPRPQQFRGPDAELLNKFIKDQREYSTQQSEKPMWLNIFKFNYGDFEIPSEDLLYYYHLTSIFASNLYQATPVEGPYQIPGTEEQRQCDQWFSERWPRITASVCQKISRMGENMDMSQCYRWLRTNFWFRENFTTADMLYGINEEPNAVTAYTRATGITVHKSGFWVNKGFFCFGASPDGLIYDNMGTLVGVLEVKCLKALRSQTISQWVENGIPSGSCVKFDISDQSLILKQTHSYYYQTQLQMLITEAKFCDFVLHSKVGNPSIERIFPSIAIQQEIIRNGLRFWYNVLAPEYFLMRVPRELLPVNFDFCFY